MCTVVRQTQLKRRTRTFEELSSIVVNWEPALMPKIDAHWHRGIEWRLTLPNSQTIIDLIQMARQRYPGQAILIWKIDFARWYRWFILDPVSSIFFAIRWTRPSVSATEAQPWQLKGSFGPWFGSSGRRFLHSRALSIQASLALALSTLS